MDAAAPEADEDDVTDEGLNMGFELCLTIDQARRGHLPWETFRRLADDDTGLQDAVIAAAERNRCPD